MKKETLEEAAERLQKDKYGIFISKDADVKGQLVIDTAKAAFLSGMNEGAKWQQEQMEKLKEFDACVDSQKQYLQEGLTKREYFAGLAMQTAVGFNSFRERAEYSVKMADTLIAELEKNKEKK